MNGMKRRAPRRRRAAGILTGLAVAGTFAVAGGCGTDQPEVTQVQGASELGDAFNKYVNPGNDKTEAAFIQLGSDLIASYTGIGTATDVIKFAFSLLGLDDGASSPEQLTLAQLQKIQGLLSSQITNASWLDASRDAAGHFADAKFASEATRHFALQGLSLDPATAVAVDQASFTAVSVFMDESYYSFPGPNGTLFDHRLALPLLTSSIAIRVQVINALDPNFTTNPFYAGELAGYRQRLRDILKEIETKEIVCYTHSAVPIPQGGDPSKFVTRSCINTLTGSDITVSTAAGTVTPENTVRARILNQQMGLGPVWDLRDSLFRLINDSYAGSQICAGENHTCSVSGQASVRFGAAGSYFARTVNQSISCSASIWGDPIPGTWKACSQSPLIWTDCVGEGSDCFFNGPKVVRYGANGSFNRLLVSDSIACGNGPFGDPAPGVPKECSYADPAWQHCANENHLCSFSGGRFVRFGNGVDWTYAFRTGPVACDTFNFPDPAPGVPKVCEIAGGF